MLGKPEIDNMTDWSEEYSNNFFWKDFITNFMHFYLFENMNAYYVLIKVDGLVIG